MKTQSINKINFSGLYTDKSVMTGGKWNLQYQPYSWENHNKSTAVKQEKLDILASYLPDNEAIFYNEIKNHMVEKEITKDILGTVTYCFDIPNESEQKSVSKIKAMNREESIKVLIQKLNKFLVMKTDYAQELDKGIKKALNQIREFSLCFDECSEDYRRGFMHAKNTKRDNKLLMDSYKTKITEKVNAVAEGYRRCSILMQSIIDVKAMIQKLENELLAINIAAQSDKVIDISRRDIHDPDRVLWNALKDMVNIDKKLLIMPHKIIGMDEIIEILKTKKQKLQPVQIVRLVHQMISRP
ncbi:hypothetical protein IJ750_07080 [bacterium]|nr:hypothetical protein [bacterium]